MPDGANIQAETVRRNPLPDNWKSLGDLIRRAIEDAERGDER